MDSEKPSDSWRPPEGVHSVRVESTAYYAMQTPEPAGSRPPVTLLALHGWGQRSVSFIRRFSALREAGVCVVAPQGPHQFYLDMETRKVGFSWLTNYDRQSAVPDLVALLDTALEDVTQRHGPLGPLFLLGFSQGVSVAYRYALRTHHAVSGVVACGGDLPPDVAEAMSRRPPIPVLLVHGREDGIVPVQKADDAHGQLSSAGWPVERHLFDGGHEIPGDAVSAMAQWIGRLRTDIRG